MNNEKEKFFITIKNEMLIESKRLSDAAQKEFENIYGDIDELYMLKFKLPILGEFKILSINVLKNNEDTSFIFFDRKKQYVFIKKDREIKYLGNELFERFKKIQDGIYFKNKNNETEKVSHDFKLLDYTSEIEVFNANDFSNELKMK
ncbi:MAG: hypothetical protein ACRCUM_01360 [Mycoplasmoidaceae bacterium]